MSGRDMPTSWTDWKLFNGNVPSKIQEYADDGYKIVIFRSPSLPPGSPHPAFTCTVTTINSAWPYHFTRSPGANDLLGGCCSNQNTIKSALEGKAAENVKNRFDAVIQKVQ